MPAEQLAQRLEVEVLVFESVGELVSHDHARIVLGHMVQEEECLAPRLVEAQNVLLGEIEVAGDEIGSRGNERQVLVRLLRVARLVDLPRLDLGLEHLSRARAVDELHLHWPFELQPAQLLDVGAHLPHNRFGLLRSEPRSEFPRRRSLPRHQSEENRDRRQTQTHGRRSCHLTPCPHYRSRRCGTGLVSAGCPVRPRSWERGPDSWAKALRDCTERVAAVSRQQATGIGRRGQWMPQGPAKAVVQGLGSGFEDYPLQGRTPPWTRRAHGRGPS